jgi:LDH2 family malate/lactate/ureidoglycolate dehydrogenase
MAEEAVRLALEVGTGFVTGRHMGHTGRIGAYADAIAHRSCLAIVVCGGPRSGHRVAPIGRRDGRLATNPIAFGCPRRKAPPLVADFSAALYRNPPGVLQPVGGTVGYSGTAPAILVELLATLLAGDETADSARRASNLAMLAIAAGDNFAERAERMDVYVRSSPPLGASVPVLLPGEREREHATRIGDGPITLDRPSWDAMTASAGERTAVPAIPYRTE